MKKWAFDPYNAFGSKTCDFCFRVKYSFFHFKGLFPFFEGMNYQLKNISDPKKVGIDLEKMGILPKEHFLRFFP